MLFAAIVEGEGLYAYPAGFILFTHVVEDIPVAVAPAIDGLLYITHNQAVITLGKTFIYQWLEIVPLHTACILELIDHDVTNVGTYLFKDKGRIAVADEIG